MGARESSSEPFIGGAVTPQWALYVAAFCIGLCEFAVAVWLPLTAPTFVFGILFLPGTAIVASYGGLAPGAFGLVLATIGDTYFLSGRQWLLLPAHSNFQIVAEFVVAGLIVAFAGALFRRLEQDMR
jgi:hypothetical protein